VDYLSFGFADISLDRSVCNNTMTHHARTGEALLDMLQRTLYEFEDGTNADPTDRADYSPDERLP
jgi:hypothetical protein